MVVAHVCCGRNNFYYITNSGWDAFDDHDQLKPGEKLTNPLIMKLALPR